MKTNTMNLKIVSNKRMHCLSIPLFVILLFGLLITEPAFAQSSPPTVNLRTAGNFVVLAKTGVSCTGATNITGDIGVSPAAATYVTGFNLIMDASGTFSTSALVTGKIYASDYTAPTPSNMTTAIGDMITAYDDAAGRLLPDFTELYAGDLTGKTLTRGLYKWSTAVLVSAGGVTISGSSTDIWIFQIAQNLELANGAMITLTGGAKPSNIFWQVGGQVTLGTTSAMKGVVLSKTAIAMNTGASFSGRALAQTAVTIDANTLIIPDVISDVKNEIGPSVYSLSQNYPNPFNPITTIQYSIEKSELVRLTVYDIIGNEVAELVNGYQEAGTYSVSLNTSIEPETFSSGVYFYRLKTGSFFATRKFVLLQ